MANNEKSFYQRLSELYPSLGIIDRTWRDKSGLYCIYNLDTDRFYVGSATNLAKRMSTHKAQLSSQYHHCAFLQRDYNLGRNNLEFHVLKVVPKEQLIQEEQKLLDTVYGEERMYNSMGSASKNLGIAQSYISLCCAGLCGDTKLWSFKKVEG